MAIIETAIKGINNDPTTKGNVVGAEEGVGASKIIVMVLCLIPLTALSIYVLNPQISTEAPEQINDAGRIGYVVPNDKNSDTTFYFTHHDGSCIFTDYAVSQGFWTQFTWHNTFWCVEDERIMYRTPESPDGVHYNDHDPVPVTGDQRSEEYVLWFYDEPEEALLVTKNMDNSAAGGFLMFLMFAELGIIAFLFRRPVSYDKTAHVEGSSASSQEGEMSPEPFEVAILSRRQG